MDLSAPHGSPVQNVDVHVKRDHGPRVDWGTVPTVDTGEKFESMGDQILLSRFCGSAAVLDVHSSGRRDGVTRLYTEVKTLEPGAIVDVSIFDAPSPEEEVAGDDLCDPPESMMSSLDGFEADIVDQIADHVASSASCNNRGGVFVGDNGAVAFDDVSVDEAIEAIRYGRARVQLAAPVALRATEPRRAEGQHDEGSRVHIFAGRAAPATAIISCRHPGCTERVASRKVKRSLVLCKRHRNARDHRARSLRECGHTGCSRPVYRRGACSRHARGASGSA